MARVVTAVCRLCRRSGDKLFLKGNKCLAKCTLEKRPKPPGPQPARPRRLSDRGQQLREKQRIRYSYGMAERQFRRFFEEASREPGVTGDNLMALLERRLDNVVFRLGFADSRAQARQIVLHGHILVNGVRTDVSSFLVKPDQVITWRQESTGNDYYKGLAKTIEGRAVPAWLALDKQKMSGKVVALPAPADFEARFNAQTVVEFYSH